MKHCYLEAADIPKWVFVSMLQTGFLKTYLTLTLILTYLINYVLIHPPTHPPTHSLTYLLVNDWSDINKYGVQLNVHQSFQVTWVVLRRVSERQERLSSDDAQCFDILCDISIDSSINSITCVPFTLSLNLILVGVVNNDDQYHCRQKQFFCILL